MMKILYKLTCPVGVRKNLCIHPLRKCSMVMKGNIRNSTETEWSSKKESEILQVVNKSNLKVLSKLINSSYASIIVSNRQEGDYESLNEFLAKNEISSDLLDKLYTAITNHKMQQKKFKVTPDIKEIKMPEKILGIHIGPSTITWAQLSLACEVLEWNSMVWHGECSKVNAFDLINIISSLVQELPVSTAYVVEELQNIKKKKNYILSTQQQITIGIISCLKLLEKQKNSDSQNSTNSIYVMKPLTSARFFNLVVGNEVVAAKYITEAILNNAKTNNKELEQIHIDDKIKNIYMKKDSNDQEQMGWSLLKATTFARLVTMFNTDFQSKG